MVHAAFYATKDHQHGMGALYEDVENFFGDIFAWYGRVVARYPLLFVLLPVLTCGLLGLGLFRLQYETLSEVLYTPIGSHASRDYEHLVEVFPDQSDVAFYTHQQITRLTYGEIIATRKQNGSLRVPPRGIIADVLSPASHEELRALYKDIWEMTTEYQGQSYTYEDVCAVRSGACVVDGEEYLFDNAPSEESSLSAHKSRILSMATDAKSNKSFAEAIRIRFNLRHNNTEQLEMSLAWERELLAKLRTYSSAVIDTAYTVSDAMNIELRAHVGEDTKFLGFSVLAMMVLGTFIGSGGNCVINHLTLAYAGVFTALMAILATFGLLSLLGLKFVNLCAVMPFIVLGIGADDMFQLLTEWRQSNIRDTIEDRMASTLRSTAVSITITSLTDLIAFCIGATSPFVSVRNFCAVSGVACVMCYLNQLTFYSGCIVLQARRIQASRHWLTCLKTKSRDELEEGGAHAVTVALCGGNPPRRAGDEGGICRRISQILYTFYPRFLLHWVTKVSVMVMFVAYLGLSIWGVAEIRKGFNMEETFPMDSFMTKFLKRDKNHYQDVGPNVMFVVETHLKYHHSSVEKHVASMLRNAEQLPNAINGSHLSWLEHFLAYQAQRNLTRPPDNARFISLLVDAFLRENPAFRNDLKFNDDMTEIVASRFYVTCQKIYVSETAGTLMLNMRRVANNSPYQVTAFGQNFIAYEHYVGIFKNTLLPVAVTMIGLLFVALVFIPHPIAVICVTISMISIALGMVAFMHFWGMTLSAITVIQIILSLGVCVSFTVNMSHSFMTATGKNRNERVTVAIEKVGVPILNGALSSLVSAVMLAFGASFIFISFFKTMVLVFFLGVLHSLVFLPVMLSFIGPRRTSKPRVFVPVSSSCRGLRDMYCANTLPSLPNIRRAASATEPMLTNKCRKQSLDGRADLFPTVAEADEENDYATSSMNPVEVQVDIEDLQGVAVGHTSTPGSVTVCLAVGDQSIKGDKQTAPRLKESTAPSSSATEDSSVDVGDPALASLSTDTSESLDEDHKEKDDPTPHDSTAPSNSKRDCVNSTYTRHSDSEDETQDQKETSSTA